jgi:hypothetical protein
LKVPEVEMQSLYFHRLITKEHENKLNLRFGFALTELKTAGPQKRSLRSYFFDRKKGRHRRKNSGSF